MHTRLAYVQVGVLSVYESDAAGRVGDFLYPPSYSPTVAGSTAWNALINAPQMPLVILWSSVALSQNPMPVSGATAQKTLRDIGHLFKRLFFTPTNNK